MKTPFARIKPRQVPLDYHSNIDDGSAYKAASAYGQASQMPNDWRRDIDTDTGVFTGGTLKWVGLAFGAFVLWGSFFPISSAVVATGNVLAEGRNQLLQHPTGGVVGQILAENGERVKKGQTILQIEPENAKADYARLAARRDLLEAQKARLIAEGSPNGFSTQSPVAKLEIRGTQGQKAILASTKTNIQSNAIFAQQEFEYNASKQRYESELSALQNQLESRQQELDGTQAQIEAKTTAVNLLQDEVNRMAPLARDGYIAKNRLFDQQSRLLEEQTRLADLEAQSASLFSQIDETHDRIDTLKATRLETTARDLSDVLSELSGVNEQLDAAGRALELTVIRAPVSGTLVKLNANTVGGVVEPGEPFGEIVPSDSKLLVEARIAPTDIAYVAPGQETRLVITAFDRRTQDPIDGQVKYVPADSSLDQNTGETYFAVQIALDEGAAELAEEMQPGMTSEVYITTGQRSFFGYLFAPISDSLFKAFRER